MKKIILLKLTLLFLATTFQSDNPPGWYQQQLPHDSVRVQDIFFADSLKGWVTARKWTLDSSFIFYTDDGGDNWTTQFGGQLYISSLDFVDETNGYAAGSAPPGIVLKTTNGGGDWFIVSMLATYPLVDIKFVSQETGWVCNDREFDGGIFKTTNGGINWIQQTGGSTYPARLFFLNNDTGWVVSSNAIGRLYRTTNGGTNWNVQYTHNSFLGDIHFFDEMVGIMTSDINLRTTNGGFNWIMTNEGGNRISMTKDSVGWVGGPEFYRILITTNKGISWGLQEIPLFVATVPCAIDTREAWAGGGAINRNIFHTTDGGGPILNVHQISAEIPDGFILYQNYPNPFNGTTKIKFSIPKQTVVRLIIFDIKGSFVKQLLSENCSPGEFEYNFDASDLSSGIYFYTLQTEKSFITKKMIFSK